MSWVSCFEELAGLARCSCAWATGVWAADAAAISRVEARSNDLLAVGVVHDDKMIIHISRLADNAPVRDAVVTRRVARHGAPDDRRSRRQLFRCRRKDLALPGAAAVDFQVGQGGSQESLKGTLDIASQPGPLDDKNSSPPAVVVGAELRRVRRRCVAILEAAQGREGPRVLAA